MLRRRDAGESDRRLIVLTRELGKIDVIAKGARKSGSRLAGSSEPLTAAVLQLAPGKRNRFIIQTQPQTSFPGLRRDYDRLNYALALAEVYESVLNFEEPAEEAHSLLYSSLKHLETHSQPVTALVWSLLAFMGISGFTPQLDRCCQTGAVLKESLAYLSPMAGGYVNPEVAIRLNDRFQARAEVVYGLMKTADLEAPPPNLKFAEECLIALYPFWRSYAERPLPALESAVNELRHEFS